MSSGKVTVLSDANAPSLVLALLPASALPESLQRTSGGSELELENIVCDSSFAKALRRRVLEDRARVGR